MQKVWNVSPNKKIEYYNVIIKIELIDVKIKSFALTRTLFIEAYISNFVVNELRIKYKEDKFTFSVLLLLKLEKHMHLWGFIDIEPCNCVSVSFEIPYSHCIIFCLGSMPLLSDQFVNISHSVLIQPQKHQSLTDFHIC